MSQSHDSHPYMSKSQLADYLASLRNNRNNGQSQNKPRESSEEESDGRGTTPLVRALKERYGSGNTTAGYVDVGMSKGKESPTKRALPPVPGKSENSTGWKVGQKNSQDAKRDDKKREEPQERSSSSTKQNDFWTTGVVRPLPAAPKSGSNKPDPRDELRMPIESLSLDNSRSNPPSINAPSINAPSVSSPRVSVPSINAPSINDPSGSSPSDTMDNKPAKTWPNVHVRSRSSPALLCAVCSKPIAGRIVTAVGSRFHPECFRCDKCSTELEHVAFYERDGKVYCHLDYHELFSPRCKHCDTPIENEVISALGNKYHPGHFFCAGCGDPFGATTPFIVRGKYPWCEKCYENKYAPKCSKCRKPVLDEVLNAMGKSWHPSGCFVCKECGRDFGDEGFFIDSIDNKPMCKSCKHIRLVRQVEKIKA